MSVIASKHSLAISEASALQNSFWGDDVRLEGVQITVPGARIVTTQPDVKGEAPTQDFLNDYLCGEFGFRKL
jgi:hypothetical protein